MGFWPTSEAMILVISQVPTQPKSHKSVLLIMDRESRTQSQEPTEDSSLSEALCYEYQGTHTDFSHGFLLGAPYSSAPSGPSREEGTRTSASNGYTDQELEGNLSTFNSAASVSHAAVRAGPIVDTEEARLTRMLKDNGPGLNTRRHFFCNQCNNVMWYDNPECGNETHKLHVTVAHQVVGEHLKENKLWGWPDSVEVEEYHVFRYVNKQPSFYAQQDEDRENHKRSVRDRSKAYKTARKTRREQKLP